MLFVAVNANQNALFQCQIPLLPQINSGSLKMGFRAIADLFILVSYKIHEKNILTLQAGVQYKFNN